MSFLLPAQDEATRHRRRKWIVAGIALAVILFLGWRPVREGWKRAYARKLVAEAEAYAAQNRPEMALERAVLALKKSAGEARALRLLLSLHGKAGDPEAFTFWAMLARHPDATFDDRRELLRWAVAWGQAEAADRQWFELQKENPLPAETVRLGAAYFELRGDPERAVLCAREAIAAKPDDIETRILLGRVLLRNGSPADRTLGKQLLIEQSKRQDQLGLQVLRLLAASGELLPFDARECVLRLQEHPRRTKSDELAIADLNVQVTPYRKEAIVAEAARQFVRSGGDLMLAGRWLLNQDAFGLVLELVPLERAAERAEFGLLHLDALAALKRWAELEQTLARKPKLVAPFEHSLFRARAALAMDQPRIADLHWEQALENSDRDATRLLTLATYARAEGVWEVAERTLRDLAGKKLFERKAYEELVRLSEAKAKPGELRNLLLEMRERFPEDPAVENDLAYLDLLEGREVEEATQAAEKLVEANPEFLSYRVTLALGHLRQGNGKAARSLLDGQGVNWLEAVPAHRAVYVAALRATGELKRAEAIEKTLPMEELRLEERRLFAEQQD